MEMYNCQFCGKEYKAGSDGQTLSSFTVIDKKCTICGKYVCSECARTWGYGHDSDYTNKLCRSCSDYIGIVSFVGVTYDWLRKLKDLKDKGIDTITCPNCGDVHDFSYVMRDFKYCTKCNKTICKECYEEDEEEKNNGDGISRLYCRSCRYDTREYRRQYKIDRVKPENNCTICSGFYDMDHKHYPGQMADVFLCTLCNRRICQNCYKNRKTGIHNVFCCKYCYEDPRKLIVSNFPYGVKFEGSDDPLTKGINLMRTWADRIADIFNEGV